MERFSGILASLLKKFFTYLNLLLSDISSTLPPELIEFIELQLGEHYELFIPSGEIDSGFSSFTAEQWKNWTCVYSLCGLYELIPQQHYSCWPLSAATISITFENWNKLMKRCKSSLQHFETFMVYNTANETCKYIYTSMNQFKIMGQYRSFGAPFWNASVGFWQACSRNFSPT